MRRQTIALFAVLALVPLMAGAQQGGAFVMEHTYWIKPGKASQFIALYRKNKLPLLQAEQAEGRILWIRTAKPRASAGNEQWDFRVTVGWRDAQSAWGNEELQRPVNPSGRDAQRLSLEDSIAEELIVERTDVPVQEDLAK